jgi:hypothetical protein
MALQSSKAQGKTMTGQTIFEVANQIIRNPNGILRSNYISRATDKQGAKERKDADMALT